MIKVFNIIKSRSGSGIVIVSQMLVHATSNQLAYFYNNTAYNSYNIRAKIIVIILGSTQIRNYLVDFQNKYVTNSLFRPVKQ